MPSESRKTRTSVKVRFFTTLREIVGKREEQMELLGSATLEAMLKYLSKKYGKEFEDYVYDELGNVRGYLQFLINGTSAPLERGLRIKLKEGDQIAILPPVGGG